MTSPIPLSDLNYGPEEEQAVRRVLGSRWLSMGPEVAAFEAEMRDFLGAAHALALSSGTAALHLALLALDIGPGDQVIQPAINFVAAANVTVAVGAEPVFADIIGLGEPTLDPVAVERLVTPRTRAVVAMHYGGYGARMAELLDLCQRHGLALVEDACHATGGRYLDRLGRAPHGAMYGTAGDIGCFSFFSNKNMATGEGGLVATGRHDLAARVQVLRSHGMTTATWDRHRGHASSYDVLTHGFNYRLDELHAALGRCQLQKLQEGNRRRAQIASAYRLALAGLDGWSVPFADHPGESAHHLFVVVAPDGATRDRARTALAEASIQTSLHYPCITEFSAFHARNRRADVPLSRAFASRVLTLPLYPSLPSGAIDEICATLTISQETNRATT